MPEFRVGPRLAEAVRFTYRGPESCLPPAFHRGGSRVQDTQRGIWTTPPMGFGPLRRFESRRSLCRFTSPAPSALRVSHPLSGLSPPEPCGSVSRHFRPWGLLPAFRALPVRSAVTPFDALCSPVVSASYDPPRASSRLAFAPVFGYAFATFLSPFASSSAPRATRTGCLDIDSASFPPRWVRAKRAVGPLTGRRARFARRGADGLREATWSSF